MNAAALQRRLRALGNPADAAFLMRFFKTGPGEYGAGDVFLGIRVPVVRRVVKEFRELPLSAIQNVLQSSYHEERLAALLILVAQTARADAKHRKAIYELYLKNTRRINNWDLVDLSAPQIVGAFLTDKSRRPLDRLARSSWLWDRRIAILATFHFIRQNQSTDTLRIAERLLVDPEDLMHKATGWMLREVGKRDQPALEGFLAQYASAMPRTMLRYAIERFPEPQRRRWLAC